VYACVARKKYFFMHIYIIEVYGFVNICLLAYCKKCKIFSDELVCELYLL